MNLQSIVTKRDALSRLNQERVALKSELDEARAQAHKLSSANQDVANRLDVVIDSIKLALQKGG